MRQRLLGGVLAGVLVAGAAVLAVVAAGNTGDDEPRALPVLGAAGTERAAIASDASAGSSLVHPGGGVTYEIGDLQEIGGEASAWRVGREDAEDRVQRLADALGLSGEIERAELAWVVTDGNARLEVQDQPGLPWWFGTDAGVVISDEVTAEGRVAITGSATPSIAVACPADQPCDDPVASPPPDEPVEPVRPADLPSRDEAEAIARKVFDAAGVEGGDVRVEDLVTLWSVIVEPTVGGLPTFGYGTYVSVGPKGEVQWANGWLGVPAEADSYPLIGTDAAVERLQENGGYAGILGAPAVGIEVMPPEECPPDADCAISRPFPEPEPIVVRVTGVRLGLFFVPAFETEEAWFVPAYLFEIDGGQGGETPVMGIPDEFLVEPIVTEPKPEPGADGGGTDGSSGQCVGSAGSSVGTEDEPANQPPLIEVCQEGDAVAGEPVIFRVMAKDSDSGIRDDCGSPVATFGDEDGTAVCDIGCDSSGPGPGELSRTFEHVYEQPGTYTATFSLRGCGDQNYEELIAASLEVTVD